MHNLCVRLKRSRRGAAAVEFALLMPIISALFIGVINYGLVTFEKMELTSAARAGVQMALANGSTTAAEITAIEDVVNASTNLDSGSITVVASESCTCTCTNMNCSGATNEHYTTVTVTEDYTLLLVPTTITLTGSAVLRTE